MTAVEWLIEQLYGNNEIFGVSTDLYEQAKEMEKQQIIDACNKMQIIKDVDCDGNVKFFFEAEQYYNETFNLSQQDKP
jgi:hypothetical protein